MTPEGQDHVWKRQQSYQVYIYHLNRDPHHQMDFDQMMQTYSKHHMTHVVAEYKSIQSSICYWMQLLMIKSLIFLLK